MGTAELGLLVCKITLTGRPFELGKLNPNDRAYQRLIQVLSDKFMKMSFNDYEIADINDEEEIQRAPPFVTSDQIRDFMAKNQPEEGDSHILVYRSTGEMDIPEDEVELPDSMRFMDSFLRGRVDITFNRFIRIKPPKGAASKKKGAAADPNRPVGAGAGPAGPAADPNRPIGAGAGPAGPAAAALPPIAPVRAAPLSKEQEDAARYKQDVEMAGGRKKRRLRSKTKKHKRHGSRRS